MNLPCFKGYLKHISDLIEFSSKQRKERHDLDSNDSAAKKWQHDSENDEWALLAIDDNNLYPIRNDKGEKRIKSEWKSFPLSLVEFNLDDT